MKQVNKKVLKVVERVMRKEAVYVSYLQKMAAKMNLLIFAMEM